ncbi:protein FAR1-RELATED SEQUENCE 5-like [Arachis hypogaea]|uniref:protein FAR1-RELATED SEQUENCE 5-like n=1 Tax=Arachis hypogaea TaxID=3818 RepID=UPI000DEC9BA0|nr:protein FAR1-RELATED SEQUENCE 5-like [Arachis hypogaea]
MRLINYGHFDVDTLISQMGISRFVPTNSRDGYHKGDARCDPGNQTDDSAEFDVMNEDSDEEASGYGDVLGLTAEDINRMVFRTEQRAYEFYLRLGKCHGFGVRKGDYCKDENGNLIRRRFFCNRAGLRDEKHYARFDRKRMHKPETRTNCEAKLSIYLDRGTSNWKVRKVILDHNHDLTPIGMVHLMPQFRGLSDDAKVHMESMHSYGLPTSKIVGYMSGIAGGYSLLGFTKKDAYNHLDKKKRGNIADGDTNATVVYLQGKAAADPMSTARYNVTNDGMLANLFWADGASRADFQHFGDVVAFDSTYRKNKYRRPLVIFSGTNNHRQTTIFGFGLLLDETTASYTWMLENLLEVMCNRMPSVVVTDGDDAIIAAVRKVFPDTTHRLCAWHLQKNVTSNGNEHMFRDLFSKWLYSDMGIEEFENEWATATEEFRFNEKCWALQMYKKKHMWVSAYLRGKFCAGYRTTSRCEGLNSHVKKFLTSRHTILELVHNLEVLVREYRNNEMVAQFNSVNSIPVMTTCLDPIEKGAARMYTRAIFSLVKKEIDAVRVVNYVAKRRISTTIVYTTEEYGNPSRTFITQFDRNMGKFLCHCRFWEREGFPCRHMFFVMKYEHVQEIPHRLVLTRWWKDAKSIDAYVEQGEADDERGFLMRHGALHEASQWLLSLSARNQVVYTEAVKGIRALCTRLVEAFSRNDATGQHRKEGCVKDPVVVRTKGAP